VHFLINGGSINDIPDEYREQTADDTRKSYVIVRDLLFKVLPVNNELRLVVPVILRTEVCQVLGIILFNQDREFKLGDVDKMFEAQCWYPQQMTDVWDVIAYRDARLQHYGNETDAEWNMLSFWAAPYRIDNDFSKART